MQNDQHQRAESARRASVLRLHTPEHTSRSKAPTKQRFQPSRDVLAAYRSSGLQWIAVDLDTVEHLLNDLRNLGIEFTEAYAMLELHLHIHRQSLYTYRDYAPRWRWKPERVRSLFRRLKLEKSTYAIAKKRTQNTAKSRKFTGTRTQSGKFVRNDQIRLYIQNRERIEEERDVSAIIEAGGVAPDHMVEPDASDANANQQPERSARAQEEKSMSQPRKKRNTADVETVFGALEIPDAYRTPEICAEIRERIRIRGIVKVEQDRKKEVSRPWPEFFAAWLARYTTVGKIAYLAPERFLYELERANLAEWDDIHAEGTAAQFEAKQRAAAAQQQQPDTSVGMVRL